jgi:hypothetical protein
MFEVMLTLMLDAGVGMLRRRPARKVHRAEVVMLTSQ